MDLLALASKGARLPFLILALSSCHLLFCLLLRNKTSLFFFFFLFFPPPSVVPADRRDALRISRASTSSHVDVRKLSATSGESLMWNIRLHSCCRTPGGVAAGKFSSSVGRGNGGERKKKNEPSTHLSECAAGGSDAGMPDFRCVFTLFKCGF